MQALQVWRRGGELMMVGDCQSRNERRMFRVDRIGRLMRMDLGGGVDLQNAGGVKIYDGPEGGAAIYEAVRGSTSARSRWMWIWLFPRRWRVRRSAVT